ncbi:response regulator transcription factor [Aliibacillus thermotolerans]|uniref:Response regulator transcription factor n=1 Tax=Aliibacillus thermotolerans TaxID=1834418 RepID=A0ABW0UA03_9BACI|nr:response regulator transcription factor [Aliibacillus thermotolerans]MDA3129827.1 response regulator [Aliibacillus thermotolerans]
MTQKFLVVEDEESIATLIKYNLEQAGYEVEVAEDGEIAIDKFKNKPFDFVMLDIMLPKVDGIEVCREIRQQSRHVPILMLTAKDDEFDKVLGLELGADDYMTKPFSPRELMARVRAILRRVSEDQQPKEEEIKKIEIGALTIYPENYEAYLNGEPIDLTPKEFELLLYLVNGKGKVITRDQLLNAVWNYEFVGDTRIVDVHISHLRDKIEPNTKKPTYIKTVRGLGYKFEGPSA